MSFGVDLIAPVTVSDASLCTFAMFLVTVTEPLRRVWWSVFDRGVYQTSAAYVSLGIATVLYSCLTYCRGIPVEGLDNRRSCRVHLIP